MHAHHYVTPTDAYTVPQNTASILSIKVNISLMIGSSRQLVFKTE